MLGGLCGHRGRCLRGAHICVHGVGLRGGYSTWHAEASIGRGMRMPLCLCMWYSYVQAVIERGSLVGTAGACVGSVCVQCRPQVCATCMAW